MGVSPPARIEPSPIGVRVAPLEALIFFGVSSDHFIVPGEKGMISVLSDGTAGAAASGTAGAGAGAAAGSGVGAGDCGREAECGDDHGGFGVAGAGGRRR